jgi:putative transcriptional regulator
VKLPSDAALLRHGGCDMSVSYNRLWKLMIDKRISKTELTHMAGISTNAMAKLGRDEDVRMAVLEKICSALNCKIEEIVEIQNDDNNVSSIETSSGK